jgi:hypothetical protein
MSLDSLVKFLITENDPESLHFRAIRLFEFQVALFYPQYYSNLLASDDDCRGAKKILKTARIYAATKFLQHIEATLSQASRGWTRIRRSISAKRFDQKLIDSRKRAETAAKIIDYSYRFQQLPNRGKWKGGITAAIYVVRTAPSYGLLKKSKNSIKPIWNDFEPTSVFVYLLLRQNFRLMPPKISKKNFSQKLLSQAKDGIALRHFFRAYQHLCEALAPSGYTSFEVLSFNLKCDVPQLSRLPFEHDVIATFEEYKKASSKL